MHQLARVPAAFEQRAHRVALRLRHARQHRAQGEVALHASVAEEGPVAEAAAVAAPALAQLHRHELRLVGDLALQDVAVHAHVGQPQMLGVAVVGDGHLDREVPVAGARIAQALDEEVEVLAGVRDGALHVAVVVRHQTDAVLVDRDRAPLPPPPHQQSQQRRDRQPQRQVHRPAPHARPAPITAARPANGKGPPERALSRHGFAGSLSRCRGSCGAARCARGGAACAAPWPRSGGCARG